MPPENEIIELVHGALDFPEGNIVLGFRIHHIDPHDGSVSEKGLLVFRDTRGWVKRLTSNIVTIQNRRYVINPKSCPPWLSDRWSHEQLNAFILRPAYPEGEKIFERVWLILMRYVELPDLENYFLVAAWTIGTYFAHLFPAYPFLFFYGPKETGKSKVLEVLERICFNAVKVRDLTAPALGDTMEGQRGTVLVDQAETMSSNLVGLLADSYKKAGGRRRVIEMRHGRRSVLEISTYGPKAFAGQRNLDPDLLDRCIHIPMIRTIRRVPDFLGSEPEWNALRDELYCYLLQCHGRVSRAFAEVPSDGTRRGELWRPIEAVLKALGVDDTVIAETRIAFDTGTRETKSQVEESEEELFTYLYECAEREDSIFILELPNITDEMLKRIDKINLAINVFNQERVQKERVSRARWVGVTIKKYSLGTRLNRITRAKIYRYQFDPKVIKDLYGRYIG